MPVPSTQANNNSSQLLPSMLPFADYRYVTRVAYNTLSYSIRAQDLTGFPPIMSQCWALKKTTLSGCVTVALGFMNAFMTPTGLEQGK